MNMNNMNMTETNVMASNAITPATTTQPTTANEPAINPMLQRWIDFCEQTANEVRPWTNNYMAQFIKNAEDIKKAKAERRLNAKLKKMEVEQKAILLAEAQKRWKKLGVTLNPSHRFPYDYTTDPHHASKTYSAQRRPGRN